MQQMHTTVQRYYTYSHTRKHYMLTVHRTQFTDATHMPHKPKQKETLDTYYTYDPVHKYLIHTYYTQRKTLHTHKQYTYETHL